MNESLGNALASTETATTVDATPDPAQVEPTQPVIEAEPLAAEQPTEEPTEKPAEKTPEEIAASKSDEDFAELRGHRKRLETELSEVRTTLEKYGGNEYLDIMSPFLQQAQQLPRTDAEVESWAPQAWTALETSMLPTQIQGLRAEAAWGYLRDPAGIKAVVTSLFGDTVTPQAIQEFAKAYAVDPSIMDVLRPNESESERTSRLANEEREKKLQESQKEVDDRLAKIENEAHQVEFQRTMGKVFEVALAPRADIKKQFGLDYQKNETDTAQMSSFRQRLSARYDDLVSSKLMHDPELNRLANTAEFLAKEKNEQQRQRAGTQFAPNMQQRVRAVCAQVAKDLAEDLSLFSSPDQAKAEQLKDLPAQVAGSRSQKSTTSGFDLSDMPDPSDERKYGAWVTRKMAEDAARRRTPAVLAAG